MCWLWYSQPYRNTDLCCTSTRSHIRRVSLSVRSLIPMRYKFVAGTVQAFIVIINRNTAHKEGLRTVRQCAGCHRISNICTSSDTRRRLRWASWLLLQWGVTSFFCMSRTSQWVKRHTRKAINLAPLNWEDLILSAKLRKTKEIKLW